MKTLSRGAPATSRSGPAQTAHTRPNGKRTKKTISAAAIFDQNPKNHNDRAKKHKNVPSHAAESAGVKKSRDINDRSRKHSPKKGLTRTTSSDRHPVVVAFKEATSTYKQALFDMATEQLDASYNGFLETIKGATIKTTPNPDPSKSSTSPKLSLIEKIDHECKELSIPLSDRTFTKSIVNQNGEKEQGQVRIGAATAHFEELTADTETKIQELQQKWEQIVGEIWKCGVQVLGEDEMNKLLGPGSMPPAATGGTDDGELFVGTEPTPKQKKSIMGMEGIPEFLTQKSALRQPFKALPDLPREQIDTYEKEVPHVGKSYMKEMEKLEDEYQQWWRKKREQFVQIMND